MRGYIIGIDGLECLELRQRIVTAMLLIIGNAKFAPRIARLRILRNHLFEIGNFGFRMALTAFHQSQIVQGARIVGVNV